MWRQQSNEKRSRNIGKIIAMFGSRLLATCGCWFLWDFSFYGNKGEPLDSCKFEHENQYNCAASNALLSLSMC